MPKATFLFTMRTWSWWIFLANNISHPRPRASWQRDQKEHHTYAVRGCQWWTALRTRSRKHACFGYAVCSIVTRCISSSKPLWLALSIIILEGCLGLASSCTSVPFKITQDRTIWCPASPEEKCYTRIGTGAGRLETSSQKRGGQCKDCMVRDSAALILKG